METRGHGFPVIQPQSQWAPVKTAIGAVAVRCIRRPPMIPLYVLALVAALAGCTYDYPDPADTFSAGAGVRAGTEPSPRTDSTRPTDPLVLEREVKNYQDLDKLLKAVPGPVLLFQEGPLDGPARGFGTTEPVPAAGEYRVTIACVGALDVKVFIRQENPQATLWPVELTVECPGSTSQVITLQQGHVSAHLSLPSPGDTPWTGAVGGVRVTG